MKLEINANNNPADQFESALPLQNQLAELVSKCVHCGFCIATCPSYQVLFEENDGPRGRIYQIKKLAEGHIKSTDMPVLSNHLERCLQCASCETTCPSSVEYRKILHRGHQLLAAQYTPPVTQRAMDKAMAAVLGNPHLFSSLVKVGRWFKPLMPKSMAAQLPHNSAEAREPKPVAEFSQFIVLVQGCVHNSIDTGPYNALIELLEGMGIGVQLVSQVKCCGAVNLHLHQTAAADAQMLANVEACMPYINDGALAVLNHASACAMSFKQYGEHLEGKMDAARLQAFCDKAFDVSEFIAAQATTIQAVKQPQRIAYHPPCTLQHGQGITGVVEQMLRAAGHELLPVEDSHLCCGAAGTYKLKHADISNQLVSRKVANLQRHQADVIVTANVGCHQHLREHANTPVRHWLEMLTDD